jgi:hypothetical protein
MRMTIYNNIYTLFNTCSVASCSVILKSLCATSSLISFSACVDDGSAGWPGANVEVARILAPYFMKKNGIWTSGSRQ